MDIVFIEQLSVITTIGVYDWEQTIEQKLVFDIEMAWDNRKAAKSDDVADCLSYADIAETVVSHVEGARFALVERDRKSTRLNSSHRSLSRMPSSA